MSDLSQRVAAAIRDVPDFPKPGILFKDITPVLADAELLASSVAWMADVFREASPSAVVGMESRGFLFGAAAAVQLGVGFVPARKPGKLPWETHAVSYDLEYGSNTLELHVDAVRPGQKVLIVDDLLATGGTARATVELVRAIGAEVVGAVFLLELGFLHGRAALDVPVKSLVIY